MLKLNTYIFFVIAVFSLNSSIVYSANEQFRSNASGNWNTLGTWQMSTNGGSTWIAATAPPRDTSGLITIRNPNTVSVTGVVTASSITIESGASLNGGSTSGSGTLIYGNIINNGTLTTGSTGGYIRIKGPSLINNGALQSNGTIYFDTTTSLSGAGTYTPANTRFIGNVTLGNSITYSPTSNITMDIGAILNLNGNTFTLTSGAFYVDNNATVSSPGTVRTQNSVQIYLNQLAAFNASLNVNTGDALATGYVSPYEGKIYGNVTIDAGATLNGGNISGRKLFLYGSVINNGTLYATSTGSTLRINCPALTNNGTLSAAGTLYFDSITTISGAGTFTPSNTIITGNITLGSNITLSPTSNITIAAGATLNPNGNIITLTSGSMTVDNNGTISAPGTVRTQTSVEIYLNQLAAFNASLHVNTGNALATGYVSPYEGKIFGNVTIDAGTTLNGGNISGKKLFLYGSVINNGTLFASSIGGTLRMRCPSITNNGLIYSSGSLFFDTTIALSGSGSFTSAVNFTTNANVTLNSDHQMNSVNINAGAAFNISNRLLKLTASNPIIATGTFTSTGSKIEYNGTALQSVSVTNITYNALRINNPAGATLLGNITIPDTLSIVLGDLNLNGRIITLTPAAYMTETPGNVAFGTSGTITTTRNISSPSGLNVAGMGAVLTQASNLGSTVVTRGHTVQTGLNGGTSIKRYYDITPTNNSGLNATLVFKYDDSELNGKPEPSLKLFKSTNTGSTWLYQGGSVNIASSQITLAGITSFSRWSADSSKVSAAIGLIMEGFYNTGTNNLNMTDTVRAYLRNISAPYAVVDSAVGLLDSLTFKSALQFTNAATGTYYIQLKHRNSLETWSKNGINYIQDSTLNYDFTFAATQAYGNNEILKGTKYCLYSGDVSQDGFIDLADVVLINNASSAFTTGYVSTDVNGNSIVDLTDILIAYNNSTNFISKKTP